MPGNEFEKQVQQKMDELNFVPSAAVWQEVEKQINERKKRRLPFLWLLLPGILLGGAAWLYTINNNEKKSSGKQPAEQAVAPQQHVKRDENKTSPAANSLLTEQDGKPMPGQPGAGERQAAPHSNTVTAPEPGIVNSTVQEKAAPASIGAVSTKVHTKKAAATVAPAKRETVLTNESVAEVTVAKKKFHQNGDKSSIEKPAVTAQKPALAGGSSADGEANAETAIINKSSAVRAIDPVAPALPLDTVARMNAIAAIADSSKNRDTANNLTAVAKKIPAAQKKKNRQWGISAGAGASNISQGFSQSVAGAFSGSSVFDAALYRNNSQNNSSPGTANGGTNLNSFTRPAKLTPGLAWSIGVFVGQPLGKGFSMKAGIGYHYYSMGLQVGTQVDSNKALLEFRNGNSAAYTNRFHCIELPVTFEKQLGKTSRFSLNTGVMVSVLAGSNALQYDAAKNTYFKDNSYINKIQAGLLAGFNYRIFQKSVLVETGPQISYGLSNIFRKELYGSTHLFAAGIHARVYFTGNKR